MDATRNGETISTAGREPLGGLEEVWRQRFGLEKDPFHEHAPPFVAYDGAREAVDRMVRALEAVEPRIVVAGECGAGKTTVLARALALSRRPGQRVAALTGARDREAQLALLARRLGTRASLGTPLPDPWATLDRALASAALDRARLVVAIDDASHDHNGFRSWIDGLLRMSARAGVPLSIVETLRIDADSFAPALDWPWTSEFLRIAPLTRDEAERFVTAKLAAAGCSSALFTPRAITRLHGLATGVPRRIERLAGASLRAAAEQGLEIAAAETVDAAAAREFEPALS